MPKTTQLPFVSIASSATSFVVVDNRLTKRLDYMTLLSNFAAQIEDNILRGPTGPVGPSGGPVPSGGNPGQIIVKTSTTNFLTEWRDPISGIPPGGTFGQVLAKTANTDYAIGWTTANTSLPVGGNTGQVLVKTSNQNFDASWGESTSVPLGGNTGQILAKLSGQDRDIGWVDAPESPISNRRVFTTSAVINNNAISNITLPAFENYVVLKIETSHPAWVRLYSDTTSRTADSNRTQGNDPVSGTGVIAEVIAENNFLSQKITPGLVGMNFDAIPTNNIYLAVKNNSGSNREITVTLTLLSLSGLSSIVTSTRIEVGATTGSLNNNETGPIAIVGSKSYILSKVVTSVPAWVRLYTDSAARSADLDRNIDNDPIPGSGIITEVLTTTGSLTQLITPGAIGFNTDTVISNNLYLSVTNKAGSTSPVTVLLTLTPIEV
jgi:hypothetical protein